MSDGKVIAPRVIEEFDVADKFSFGSGVDVLDRMIVGGASRQNQHRLAIWLLDTSYKTALTKKNALRPASPAVKPFVLFDLKDYSEESGAIVTALSFNKYLDAGRVAATTRTGDILFWDWKGNSVSKVSGGGFFLACLLKKLLHYFFFIPAQL